ncbi:fibro-slime domain-containing protein [Thalassotalea agarivorans]|uniref:Fibro-slime domain-containing protein/PEP-CTERM protein-sorting domain-containing protein n=1 Tax=Thalassotalea agarivorans TaxID=349064 RepID=A0A1I0HQK8_THASX|nr:fibro-slime domain-containing protein [Thalassotalea agarivorans]SET86314.1 fibro-slime domain-containing protein/PEP-CTERM protein-sorting domain-containing protein [Thalassotalea agarivorans]
MKNNILKILITLIVVSISLPTNAEEIEIPITYRDFRMTHPDFNSNGVSGVVTGLVEDMLVEVAPGVWMPNYAPDSVQGQIETQDVTSWFYGDCNADTPEATCIGEYDSFITANRVDDIISIDTGNTFFPLSDPDLVPESQWDPANGRNYNYFFTAQMHFDDLLYDPDLIPDEFFTFSGDDDVWVYINGKLAIDLGGIHAKASQTIKLSELAAIDGNPFQLEAGEVFSFDFFFAERHHVESNFAIQTSFARAGSFRPVPEPSTLLIFAMGLLALVGKRRLFK